ncbi:EAL domain-containing protein, partial [Escherichia coli]
LSVFITVISGHDKPQPPGCLLEAITSIGQSLNLTVVAEGVETKEQFEMLRKIHCRVIQGYFFSRPLPAEEIPGWMSSVLPLKI